MNTSVQLDPREFGARGNGTTADTQALQRTFDEAGNRGGATVILKDGRFLTGSLVIHSHTTLRVEHGAVLQGSPLAEDYPLITTRWEGADCTAHRPLLYAKDAHNIAVDGSGVVDGGGEPWWRAQRARVLRHPRPRLLGFESCRHVAVTDVQLQNSPVWTIHPFNCVDVAVRNVSIQNPPFSPNTDGVNPESCDGVIIEDCRISTGDDCIAIKAGMEQALPLRPCCHIHIRNCILERGHGAVVIGSEMSGGVHDVSVVDCVFTGTERGIRFKTRRGRGGVIERIRVSGITMQQVGTPFAVNMYYIYTGPGGRDPEVQDRTPKPVTVATPVIRDLQFQNVCAEDAWCAAGFILGLPESPVEEVSFDDVSISMQAGAKPTEPEMAVGVAKMTRAGFIATHMRRLVMKRFHVEGQDGEAFVLEHVAPSVFEELTSGTEHRAEAPRINPPA